MNGVYNDNNLINVRKMDSLVDTVSYCKKFGFSRYDLNHIMYSFDDQVIVTVDMEY